MSEQPPVDFAPLSFGDLLERALKVSWGQKKHFALIVSILVIPPTLLLFGSLLSFPWDIVPATPEGSDYFAQGDQDFDPARLIPFATIFGVGLVLAIVGSLAARGASIDIALRAHAGLTPDWRSSIRKGIRRTHSVAWVMLLIGVLVGLTLAVIIAPGVVALIQSFSTETLDGADILSVLMFLVTLVLAVAVSGLLWLWWVLAPVIVIAEPDRGWTALKRSRELVKGKVFWIGAVLFVALIAQWTIASVFTVPSALLPIDPASPDFGRLLLLQLVLGLPPVFVYLPVQASVDGLVYVDARVRKEGLTQEGLQAELTEGTVQSSSQM